MFGETRKIISKYGVSVPDAPNRGSLYKRGSIQAHPAHLESILHFLGLGKGALRGNKSRSELKIQHLRDKF
jgi:hypothetical protein